MWGKKFHILAIIVAVVALIGIYQATRSPEEKLNGNLQSALEDHDHEEALLYASQLLKLQPGNPTAKKTLADSSQIFVHLKAAREALADFWTLKDGAAVEPEILYQGLQQAREHLGEAKALDPKFDTTIDFEEKLDQAQAQLIYIFASHVMTIGDGTVSKASEEYQKASEVIESAASSKYLSKFLQVQSAWATVEEPADAMRSKLDEELGKMDALGNLVASYQGKSAKRLVKALENYRQSVRDTIDSLLLPHGNYNEFVEAVDQGSKSFAKAQQRLVSRIPGSYQAKDNYSALLEEISEYQLFENDATSEILSQSQAL